MEFLVIAYDGTDSEASSRRAAARPAHLALAGELIAAGQLPYAAAILDEQEQMIGSMMVLSVPDRGALDEWLAKEPYVMGQVWQDVKVQPCRPGPMFVKN